MAYTRTNVEGEIAPVGFHYMPDGTLMSDAEHEELYGEKVIITKHITGFSINDEDLAVTTSTRQLTINGDTGSEFILQIFDASSPTKFYDFTSKTFVTEFTSTSSLKVEMKSNKFIETLIFPADTNANTYSILLLAPPDKNTLLDFSYGKNSYTKSITRVANAVLTLTSVSSTSAAYGTPPTVTSTSSSAAAGTISKTIDWTLTNSPTEANGFGLRLIRQPIDTDWIFPTTLTYTVVGNVAPSDVNDGLLVIVSDVTDLCAGMHVTSVSSGSLAAATIVDIDISAKKLKLSTAQTFSNGVVLKFEARGSATIKNAIGVNINFENFNSSTTSAVAGPDPFTKTIRATGTNEVIALTDTYGLHGGDHIVFKGLNVNNAGENVIRSVVINMPGSDPSDGTITTILDQTAELATGTKLHFTSKNAGETFGTQVRISNTVKIISHPSTARYIYLNLDNFITLGVSGL